MKDQSRTKQELLKENAFLKQKVQELEHSESERKHADAVLRESEERFHQLFDHIADGVAVYQGVDEGQDFVFVDINRTGQFLSKIRLDEAVGRRVTEVFPSVERMGLLDVFRRVWRTGQPEHHPLTEYADDRIVQWVENYVFKLLSGLIVVIYSDTTEKHRAEEALRQSEENFRHSLDDSPLGVRIVTEEGETIYTNRAVLDIYGYDSVEELRTTPIKKRYTPESYADFLIRREKRRQGLDVPSEYNINIIRKDGEVRFLNVIRSEILWDGERQFQVIYNDITERKRAEEALRESENRYRAFFDKGHDGIVILDPETAQPIEFNDQACRQLGYTREEFAQLRLSDIEIKETAEETQRHIRKVIDKGYDDFETRQRTKQGEIRHVHVTAQIIEAVGSIVYHCIWRDITKRMQAEEKLKESEERYRQLFENAPAGIYEIDLTTGRLLSVNDVICKYTGYTRDELLATNALDLLTGESQKIFIERMAAYAAGESAPSILEYQARSKSGHEFWMSLNARYIYNAGFPVRATVVAHDITERKRTEEALKDSEKMYRSLFENMINGFSYCRMLFEDGKPLDFIYLAVNNAFGVLTGLKDVIGRKVSELIPNIREADPQLFEIYGRVSMTGQPERFEMFVKSLHMWFSVSVYSPSHEHFVAVFDVITKRKWAEDELRASQQQLRAFAGRLQKIREEERVMIAREIHDEMGGGLTGLKMDLSWLLRKMGDADPFGERVALMDKIHTSNALIDQMIHVVRRISTDLRPSVLDDLGLIAALEWQLSEFTSRTEIQHEFIKTFDYVYLEEGTAVAVFRIFQEALTNIVRHSRATKVVIVLLEGERSLFGDESLVLEIRDNGRGITEEEILNKDSLGLLGMKERVLTFGGELSICGEPGGGTALILKIPRKK